MKSICIVVLCLAQFAFGHRPQPFFLPPELELEPHQRRSLEEDATLNVPELLEKYGYPSEVHHVQTKDGYILELHRIPYGRKSGPKPNKRIAFVQHGVLSSSADWILAGPEKGLGYLLADLGYDVWMGNFRGNTYSKKHIHMAPSKGAFWEFSWHEIGKEDLPAMIDYVLAVTKQDKMYYIGHSQGTTAFYVMCSERPEYNNKIKAMFSLAPIAYMSHMTSPLMQIISKFQSIISWILDMMGLYEFLPSNKLMAIAGQTFCNDDSLTQFLCTNTLFVLCGFNKQNLNNTLLPVIMGHTPAGASTRQFLHYAQEINSGYFRQYDFGIVKNMIKYGSIWPPKYDLSKITAPVALHWSRNDWLSAASDVYSLYKGLKNPIGRFQVADETFNHLDYLWGINANVAVYPKVFSLMGQCERKELAQCK